MSRIIASSLVVAITCLLLMFSSSSAATPFPQTGFSITNEKIQDYFDHRGGLKTLGPPISREFDFRCPRTSVPHVSTSSGRGLRAVSLTMQRQNIPLDLQIDTDDEHHHRAGREHSAARATEIARKHYAGTGWQASTDWFHGTHSGSRFVIGF